MKDSGPRYASLLICVISTFLILMSFGAVTVFAFTNIDAADYWAWNDSRGWLDFRSTNTVEVTNAKLTGYAAFDDEPADYISFDCSDAPPDHTDICDTSNYVVVNDRLGALSGYAWNDGIGWISFSCDQTAVGGSNTCSTSNYGVNIDSETSEFMGYAWNDSIGWISFNCLDEGICDVSSYRVKTAWSSDILALDGYLISKTIDTGEAGGAAFNYILWRGDLGQTGNTVKFQLATSNCLNGAIDSTTAGDGAACNESIGWGGSKASGDGAFLGSGGTSVGYYEPNGPGIPAVIDALNHNNKRYYRYKMFLDRPTGNTISPVVEDVVVNWSP